MIKMGPKTIVLSLNWVYVQLKLSLSRLYGNDLYYYQFYLVCRSSFSSQHAQNVTALNIVSRSSSNSSINSLASDARTPSSPSVVLAPPSFSPMTPLRTPSEWTENVSPISQIKTPLKEQQPNKLARDWSKTHITG